MEGAVSTLDQHYVDHDLARLYDLDSGWSEDRDFYLRLPTRDQCRILDIGCGTGLLADAYAGRGHRVTAIDPAGAMLDVAREKPNAASVEWVEADAEGFRTDKRYDLIVMTGNAMMALKDLASMRACFDTMQYHLDREGSIVFEVRNPNIDWSSQWEYDITLRVDEAIVKEKRRFVRMAGPVMHFEFDYEFSDKTFKTRSAIRFHSKDEIVRGLGEAGLRVSSIVGGWQGQDFDAVNSRYMIFTATHAA